MIIFRNMTSLVIIILLFINGCSNQNKDKETEEYKKFQRKMSFHCSTLETKQVASLKDCSHDNIYCKSMLGNIYYRMKQYEKAYDLLIESQDDLTGFYGLHWAPSEWALGEMYAFGRGVSENKEEAKSHFTKCAIAGNKQCISWMISYAKTELKDAQQQTTYHNPNSIDYAARGLLYWYVMGSYYGEEISELKKIIINKKIAEEWQLSAQELRESSVIGLVGLNTTYPFCNDHFWPAP